MNRRRGRGKTNKSNLKKTEFVHVHIFTYMILWHIDNSIRILSLAKRKEKEKRGSYLCRTQC
jgi:hypothetical protein